MLDPGNGMGVSFGDYNNDGLLDLHASNMTSTAGNRILGRLFPNAGRRTTSSRSWPPATTSSRTWATATSRT